MDSRVRKKPKNEDEKANSVPTSNSDYVGPQEYQKPGSFQPPMRIQDAYMDREPELLWQDRSNSIGKRETAASSFNRMDSNSFSSRDSRDQNVRLHFTSLVVVWNSIQFVHFCHALHVFYNSSLDLIGFGSRSLNTLDSIFHSSQTLLLAMLALQDVKCLT